METTNNVTKVSVPCCGKMKEIEVDYDALNETGPVKVGHIHPNLATQAEYGIKTIERLKGEMLVDADKLLDGYGLATVIAQIDAINDLLNTAEEHVKEELPEHTEWFTNMTGKVWTLASVAKGLIDLYVDRECLETQRQTLECATKGVLI